AGGGANSGRLDSATPAASAIMPSAARRGERDDSSRQPSDAPHSARQMVAGKTRSAGVNGGQGEEFRQTFATGATASTISSAAASPKSNASRSASRARGDG